MAAELEKLSQLLTEQGFSAGAQRLRDFASSLHSEGLIPDELETPETRAARLAEQLRPFLGKVEDQVILTHLTRDRGEIERPRPDEPYPEWVGLLQGLKVHDRLLVTASLNSAFRAGFRDVGSVRKAIEDDLLEAGRGRGFGKSRAILLTAGFKPLIPPQS